MYSTTPKLRGYRSVLGAVCSYHAAGLTLIWTVQRYRCVERAVGLSSALPEPHRRAISRVGRPTLSRGLDLEIPTTPNPSTCRPEQSFCPSPRPLSNSTGNGVCGSRGWPWRRRQGEQEARTSLRLLGTAETVSCGERTTIPHTQASTNPSRRD